MVIKIDEVKEDSIEFVDDTLNEYIDAIRKEMFSKDELVNSYNVIEKAGLDEEISEIVDDDTRIVNSYINNVLMSFHDSLMNFKKFKEKDKK